MVMMCGPARPDGTAMENIRKARIALAHKLKIQAGILVFHIPQFRKCYQNAEDNRRKAMDAVFGRSDPFEEDPLTTAFYHPAPVKEIPFEDKKTCLSPKLTPQISAEGGDNMLQPTDFLSGSNALRRDLVPTKDGTNAQNEHSGSSKFEESWPSTEQAASQHFETPSFLESKGVEGPNFRNLIYQNSGEVGEEPTSTIARYIHRFRNEPPKSREERDRRIVEAEKDSEFWWADKISSSSTPKESDQSSFSPPVRLRDTEMKKDAKKSTAKNTRRPPASPEQKRGFSWHSRKEKARGIAIVSNGKNAENDSETDVIQQRAQKLIEISECTLTSSSTDDRLKPLATKKGPNALQRHLPLPFAQETARDISRHVPGPNSKLAREDDILYQWRLARKMEKARHGSEAFSNLPTMNQNQKKCAFDRRERLGNAEIDSKIDADEFILHKNGHSMSTRGIDEPSHGEYKTAQCQTVSSYTLPLSKHTFNVDYTCVPSHMHTECDILPCPHKDTRLDKPAPMEKGRTAYCPKQGDILKKSSLEIPIPLVAPLSDQYCPSTQFPKLVEGGKVLSDTDRLKTDLIVENYCNDSGNEDAEIPSRKEKQQVNLCAKEDEIRELNEDPKLEGKGESPWHIPIHRSSKSSTDKNILTSKQPENIIAERNTSVWSAKNEIQDIKQAINEVISTNLFTSSISSDASNSSKDQFTFEERQRMNGESNETNDLDSSDGEFQDDDILQILRLRKRQYKQTLSEIVKLLEEFSDEEL